MSIEKALKSEGSCMSAKCTKEKEIKTLEEFVSEMKPLIPTLKRIVEAEEAKSWLSIKIANGLKITGIIIGTLASIFGIIYSLIKNR